MPTSKRIIIKLLPNYGNYIKIPETHDTTASHPERGWPETSGGGATDTQTDMISFAKSDTRELYHVGGPLGENEFPDEATISFHQRYDQGRRSAGKKRSPRKRNRHLEMPTRINVPATDPPASDSKNVVED